MSFDVVAVGSVNRDYVFRVDALPTPGQTLLGGLSVGSGGKGGNQAVAASLLGARTAMVARVGEDPDGEALVAELARAGVDTGCVVPVSTVRTGVALVLVDAAGDNSIVVAPGANHHLEAPAVTADLGRLIGPTSVVVTQAEIPAETAAAAVAAAESVGCRAVLNLAPYRPVPDALLALCDPLVLNESEAGGLLGSPVHGVEAARKAVAVLRRRTRSVVLTVGAEGALAGVGSDVHHVPADEVEVVDTTGAGDAFTGALAAALSVGHDLVEAVRVGVRAGTYAVTAAGAQASYPTHTALGLEPMRRSD